MAVPVAGRRCLAILAGMAGFVRSGNPVRQSRGYRPARTLGTRLSVDSSA